MIDPSQTGSKELGWDALITIAEQHPYVKATMFAAEIYGAISEYDWKQKASRDLRKIREKLEEMDSKLTNIWNGIVEIKRMIELQGQDNLISQIRIAKFGAYGTLSNYDSADVVDVSQEDAEVLKNFARTAVSLASEVKNTRLDAFGVVADAFGLLILTAKLTGKEVMNVNWVRDHFLKWADDAHTRYLAQAESEWHEAYQLWASVPPHLQYVFVGQLPALEGLFVEVTRNSGDLVQSYHHFIEPKRNAPKPGATQLKDYGWEWRNWDYRAPQRLGLVGVVQEFCRQASELTRRARDHQSNSENALMLARAAEELSKGLRSGVALL